MRLILILLGLCLSFAAQAQTIAITAIGSKPPAAPFVVAGTLSGNGSPPTLQYDLNGGAWLPLPGGASVSTTAFSFSVPAQVTVASAMLGVRYASSPSINATAAFAITNGFETPSNFDTNVPGTVITTSCNEAFALSNGGQVLQNGIIDGVTTLVTEIAYFNHAFYQLGDHVWYTKACAANTYTSFGTTSPLTALETIAVNNIAQQPINAPFNVSGSVTGAVEQPVLKYQVNAGPLTSVAYSTLNGPFSFTAAGLPAGAVNIITILDALTGASGASNQFCVGGSVASGGHPVLLIFGVNRTYPYITDQAAL